MLLKIFLCGLLFLKTVLPGACFPPSQLDIWTNLKELHLEFSDIDNRRLNRIAEQKENAEIMIARATENNDIRTLERAFNDLFSASKEMFELYDKYCKSEREEMPVILPDEFEKIKEFEISAGEKMKKSEILKEEAEKAEGFNESKQLYMMAYDLAQLALLNKGRTLRVYQDYPVMYSYQWYEDKTIVRDTTKEVAGLIENERGEMMEEDVEKIEEESRDEEGLGRGVTYIVQIAAHTNEITDDKLKTIYSGERKVNMMVEDNWYKYYFGPFSSFEEADRVMKSLNVTNVFIAAYLDNQRISIGEAVEIKSRQD